MEEPTCYWGRTVSPEREKDWFSPPSEASTPILWCYHKIQTRSLSCQFINSAVPEASEIEEEVSALCLIKRAGAFTAGFVRGPKADGQADQWRQVDRQADPTLRQEQIHRQERPTRQNKEAGRGSTEQPAGLGSLQTHQ